MSNIKTGRHGRGVYSRTGPRGTVYSIVYRWFDPEAGETRKITERVPPDDDGTVRLKTARALKARREKDRLRADFTPPHIERERRQQGHAAATEAAAPLVFENAAARFLAECAEEYARPEAVRAAMSTEPGRYTGRPGPLAEAFVGRRLDSITKVDVRQYFLDRLANSGPFEGRTRRVTRRAPEQEITFLSALYTFLEDAGHALDNPCHRPRTRRKDSPLAAYRPAHELVMPTPGQLRAIFQADPRARGAGRGEGKPGKRLVTDPHRALWMLCYYTAARPESEPCRLTHGDVTLSEGDCWGSVTYRDTKTGGDRRLLLHPEAEAALKAVMLPVPMDPAERERWPALPVFRKRPTPGTPADADPQPWDSSSYGKAWAATVRAVSEDAPELAGLWLRDLRKVAKTRMVDAGINELVVNRILGHRDGVTARYYKLTDDAQQRALEALTLGSETCGLSADCQERTRPFMALPSA